MNTELTWDYLNGLIGRLGPDPVFSKDGHPIKHEFFELPMSSEATALAVTQGWKQKTVYGKDKQTGELVPRTMFEIPEV